MAEKKKNGSGKVFVWIVVGLAMLGLGGFGASGLSGNLRTIGSVGEMHIDVQQYANRLSQEIRQVEAQTGQQLPFARAQEIGLDQAVLQQLITSRALDHEAAQLGISIGDGSLAEQIVEIPAFQGVNGEFDREGYAFALERSGQSEADFENNLREETSRTLLQGALVSGVVMPDTYTTTLLNFFGETRNFTWARLSAGDLTEAVPEPTEADLRAYYDANLDQFMLAETKQLTYVALTPDELIGEIDVPEEELRAEFDARVDEYNQPERRLIERLVFLDQASADQAAAALEVNGTTFEALVEERGLNLADVDMGDNDRLSLDAAGEAVFSAEVGDVVGPLPSDLGPALFRINGILPAQVTTFEQAKPVLQDYLATDRARRMVERLAQDFEDILAGGATLEELAGETEMTVGEMEWYEGYGEGIAAYSDFGETAATLTTDDFPQIDALDDGGIFAMRLNGELPVRADTFENARDQIKSNWQASQVEDRLTALAQTYLPQLESGTEFAGIGLTGVEETDQNRQGYIGGTPPSFLADVFKMEVGKIAIVDSFGTVLVVRLDAINPASENDDVTALATQLQEQVNQQLAQDLFNAYASDTVLRAGQNIDPRALQAVHVNFP
ncbi:MAG: peptidyl-prolyl cis-trans isomerase D [Ascidiaceihabitans sp.]|jgi:peptidyl-prolyl cis-trans isomerase D